MTRAKRVTMRNLAAHRGSSHKGVGTFLRGRQTLERRKMIAAQAELRSPQTQVRGVRPVCHRLLSINRRPVCLSLGGHRMSSPPFVTAFSYRL
jgi:hypothetical protein